MDILKLWLSRRDMGLLEVLLSVSLLLLAMQFVGPLVWSICIAPRLTEREKYPLRNSDFPNTHISLIHLDLTSPHHYVTLKWAGPKANMQETGPFHSSPGAGLGYNDCNDPVESNCQGSLCTPMGEHVVEGFADYFDKYPMYTFLTIIDRQRAISFHYHPGVPDFPASQGCIRLDLHAAQLIHNNSIAGVTKVLVDGTWTNPSKVTDAKLK